MDIWLYAFVADNIRLDFVEILGVIFIKKPWKSIRPEKINELTKQKHILSEEFFQVMKIRSLQTFVPDVPNKYC